MSDGVVARAAHAVMRVALAPGRHAFAARRGELEAVQRAKLARLLRGVAAVDRRVDPHWRWEDFRARQPVSCWPDWSMRIGLQRALGGCGLIDSPIVRYQPTSGSTSAIKWVPYTRAFLAELDAAIAPWLGDLYVTLPGVRRGRHYWSLSWLPTALRAARQGDLNDDLALLSAGKRRFAQLTQAVPQETSLAATSDDSLFATLAFLAADDDLSALSVWSPTFALGLVERLGAWRGELAMTLSRGDWGDRGAAMGGLRCPRASRAASLLRDWNGRAEPAFLRALWPRLALLSAWDTAAAAPWAANLRALFPGVAFQGKGLWATEGVVTIPFAGAHVLAYRSHVYEFQDRASGRVFAPWELEEGQCVSPLLSTGSGLLRYRLEDIVRVDGFQAGIPVLRFLGRADGADLVGEKIAATFAQQALQSLPWDAGCAPVTLLALDDAGAGRPGYLLLVEATAGARAGASGPALAAALELALSAHFHYRVARDLGQLDPARVLCAPGLRAAYAAQCVQRGMIEGNVKVEPLRHWPSLPDGLRRAFRPAHDGAREATPA